MLRRASVSLVIMAMFCARTEAATYTLQNPVYGLSAPALAASLQLPISLTISDAAVERGSFNFSSGFTMAPSGDTADFVNLTDGSLFISNSFVPGVNLTLKLSFDTQGLISSGSLILTSNYNDLAFMGSSNRFGGSFIPNGDTLCGAGFDCGVTGTFGLISTVPEPSSLALLGLPVAALVRKRRPL